MRKLSLILSTWLLLAASLAGETTGKLSPRLQSLNASNDSLVSVVAFLESQAPVYKAAALQALSSPRHADSHLALVQSLKARSRSAQFAASLQPYIESGEVQVEREFWIADALSLKAKPEALAQIAKLPELHYVVEDVPLQLIDPVSIQSAAQEVTGSWSGIDLIGAREMWNRGYTGHGRLVCSFDTGVEGDHPALASRWRGNFESASSSWFDPFGTTAPSDLAGHGTHTMGLMVGRDGADTIGVAFNAEWMSAAVIDRGQSLSKTISDILAAFEWVADPDGDPTTVDDLPDVLCNSWGIPAGLLSPCDETFWQAIDNLEDLGVVAVFACGNEGPDPHTVRNPADRASGPGNSFSVGAVDQTQLDLPVAEFSSRGPGSCDDGDIKPEVVAPGVAIRSCYKDGSYKAISGTSMAAPIVAGAVALLREYNPDATVEQIKDALMASARDLGPVGEDNDYGWGLIDVAAAMELLPVPNKPHLELARISIAGSDQGILTSGTTSSLEFTLTNNSVAATDLWARLRCSSDQVLVLKDSVFLGSAADGEQVAAGADPFMVKLDHELPAGTPLAFNLDVYSEGQGFLNSLSFTLVSDQPSLGVLLHSSNDKLDLAVSNFGLTRDLESSQLGREVLSQMSLLVADQFGDVVDAVPGNLDWLASEGFQIQQNGTDWESRCKYQNLTGGIQVTQTSRLGLESGYQNYVVIEYEIAGAEIQSGNPLEIGLAMDIDLDGGEEFYQSDGDWLARTSGGQTQIGVRVLPTNAEARLVDGGLYKSGYATDIDKSGWLAQPQITGAESASDQVLLLTLPEAGSSSEPIRFAVVIAVGVSELGVQIGLDRGAESYLTPTAVDDVQTTLPDAFSLSQNYPNPFNPETMIEFALPSPGSYRLEIFNTLGQVVHTEEDYAAAGPHQVIWTGTDDQGRFVATGVYFYRLTFAGNSLTRKMVLLK